MSNKVTILFLIDTSGSMYGRRIEAVNAALVECMNVLDMSSRKNDISVGYVRFDERIGTLILQNDFTPKTYSVKANSDGFYNTTSFACLYNGLYDVIGDLQDVDSLYMFLISDGKPVDSGEYNEIYERVNNNSVFKKAERYVAVVGDEDLRINEDELKFVGSYADNVIKLRDLSSLFAKLSFNSDSSAAASEADSDRYSNIFGD